MKVSKRRNSLQQAAKRVCVILGKSRMEIRSQCEILQLTNVQMGAAFFQLRQLLHVVSGKCLEMSHDGAKLRMMSCDTSTDYQRWTFQEYDEEKARKYGLA